MRMSNVAPQFPELARLLLMSRLAVVAGNPVPTNGESQQLTNA